MLSPTGRWVSACILVFSAVHFVSLLFWYELGDGGGDSDGSSPTPGASSGWNVTQVERRLAQMTLYTCGWDQGVLAARLFPDYRPVGRLDNSHEPPTNHSVLVMGKYGPCRRHSPTEFPGHVLTIDGEGGALLSTEPKLPAGGPVPGFFGAVTLIGHYPEMTDALLHPERKVVNTGERFLLYIAGNCLGYREEAFDRLAAAGASPAYYGGKCKGNGGGNWTIIRPTPKNEQVFRTNDEKWKGNHLLFRRYRFCLVMENKNKPGYITEKLINGFLGGCVPIYHGTSEVFDIFNRDAFVFYDIDNPGPALDRVAYLERNATAYGEVLRAPILAHGNETVERHFSYDDAVGGGLQKRRIREMMGLQDA